MAQIDFGNRTQLDNAALLALIRRYTYGWRVGNIVVRIRYSRSAAYSGTCYYAGKRIFVNIGRHVCFPYKLATHLARTKSVGRSWHKPLLYLTIADGYQLALFIYLHELYHLLVKIARRNTRQKESMCDRFAAATLVDDFGVCVTTAHGTAVPRSQWDFQNLLGFVAAARDKRVKNPPPMDTPQPMQARAARQSVNASIDKGAVAPHVDGCQLLLF